MEVSLSVGEVSRRCFFVMRGVNTMSGVPIWLQKTVLDHAKETWGTELNVLGHPAKTKTKTGFRRTVSHGASKSRYTPWAGHA